MIFLAALRKEFLEQLRTYRLLIVAVVLVAFGMLSPLTAKFMRELFGMLPGAEQFASLIPVPSIKDAIDQYVKNISQFALFLSIFVSMGAIAQEKEKGTAVLMLVKPLGRGTFLLAKFLALGGTFLIGIFLAAVAGYYYTLFVFEPPALGAWLGMNGLLWLYVMVYVALTLCASAIFRSQAAAAGVGIGALLVLSGVGAIPGLGEYLPGQLVAWGSMLFTEPAARWLPALWISLGIILVSLLIAWTVFEKQEL